LIAHGDYKSSQVVGRRIEEINLPKGATIGAIVRKLERPTSGHHGDQAAAMRDVQAIIAHHDTVVEPDDHVIVFVVNKEMVSKVEKLFQVNVGFL
jgi:trk system potassium uptake protein TrkA